MENGIIFSKDFEIDGKIAENIYKSFLESGKEDIILFNIGTDKIVGDCLGPLLGTIVSNNLKNINVYGTLESPIHAKNIEENIDQIHKIHKNSYIVAIDAAVGKKEDIGSITLSSSPIKAGAAFKDSLPEIGDCSIKGAVSDGENYFVFAQSIRLSLVYNMVLRIESELIYLDKLLDTLITEN